MSVRTLLASVLLLTAATAHGQWRENGEVVPDQAWRKSDGDFGAMLLLTDEPAAFLERWSRPAAAGYRPNIKTVTDARRGDVVAAMILFMGCAPDASGKCEASADFRVVRPDGSVYAEHPGAELWHEAPPGKTALQLGVAHLAFEIERDDPIGVYKIYATVRDPIGKRSVALVEELAVAPSLPE